MFTIINTHDVYKLMHVNYIENIVLNVFIYWD